MERFQGKGRAAGQLLRGLTAAFAVTVILLFLLALILLKLQPDIVTTQAGIYVVYVLSCFAGGWYCGRKAGQRKFLWGMLIGALYFAVLCAVSGMSEQSFSGGLSRSLIAAVLCCVGGMVGGMLA